MKPLVIDLETSISDGPHGPAAKDPSNDVYTFIYGSKPTEIEVYHDQEGTKRQLPLGLVAGISKATYTIGHNLCFDLCYIWHNKEIKDFILRGGKIWCTQTAEYVLTAQQHIFSSLGELQEKYSGTKQKIDRISQLYSRGIGADKILRAQRRCPRLFKLYNEYCRLDGSSTLEIFKKQYIRARNEGMLPSIELANDYLLGLVIMECEGIHIDVNKTELTLKEFNLQHYKYLELAQKTLASVWDNEYLPEFNINSPNHKSAVLFGGEIKCKRKQLVGKFKNGNDKYATIEHKVWLDGFGISKTITHATKTPGLYGTGDEVVIKIPAVCENPLVLEYCEHQKQASMYKKAAKTYCQAFLKLSVDGKLYPHFNNTETKTGRLSSSKPNMQNISKRNQFGSVLHSLFIAPTDWVCCQIDFSQLEIYVSAWLSGDPLLTEHLLKGTDLHIVRLGYYNEQTYDELYKLCKVDEDPHWTKQRTYAKTVSYQMAYGAMPPSVSISTGLELSLVKTIFDKERETYPLAAGLGDTVRAYAEKNHKISYANNIPAQQKKGIKGSRINGQVELLPIFDKDGQVYYNSNEIRRVGYWSSPTGRKYRFLDVGTTRFGPLKRNFSFTQTKNYPMQGTAAEIQGATTAALTRLLLLHPDKIKMINEVHDSKWFYIHKDYVGRMIPKLRNIIENVPKIFKERFNITVPFNFPVDIEIGENFAEMTKYE